MKIKCTVLHPNFPNAPWVLPESHAVLSVFSLTSCACVLDHHKLAGVGSRSGVFCFWVRHHPVVCPQSTGEVMTSALALVKMDSHRNLEAFLHGPKDVPWPLRAAWALRRCLGGGTWQSHVFVSSFTTRMVLSAQELFAIEKKATAGMGNMIATALGLPQSITKRWLQRLRSEGEMVSHNVGRPRGAEAGLCLVFFAFLLVSHLANCAFVQWVR